MKEFVSLSLGERLARVSALRICAAIGGVTLLSATAYWFLTALGHGLLPTTGSQQVSFGDCLYFSFVTISTLGYGDLRPVGISRIIAGGEVIFGVLTFALVVSKLASARDSTMLRLLYSSDQQRRLREFAETINSRVMRLAADVNGNARVSIVREHTKDLRHTLHILIRYLRYQENMRDLLNLPSSRQVTFMFDALFAAVTALGGLANVARKYPATRVVVQGILEVIEQVVEVLISEGAQPLARRSEASMLQEIIRQRKLLDQPLVTAPSVEFLTVVRQALPPKPWPVGIHKVIASQLNVSNRMVSVAIQTLIESGEV